MISQDLQKASVSNFAGKKVEEGQYTSNNFSLNICICQKNTQSSIFA